MSIIKAQIVDIHQRKIYAGEVHFENGRITAIRESDHDESTYIMPGFVDAHVHIESSMLIPSEFARMAVLHGTVATVSDPHEIGNVMGIEGVRYMIENGNKVPLKFFFGAPSCVPATSFETAGAIIDAEGIKQLLAMEEILYLAEMMNYPGVIFQDEEVVKKIRYAHEAGKPVDGHAPGVRGEDLKKYISAGISTDHECFTREEALEKINMGMKVLIREGSAARNFEALISLLPEYPERIMFCSDDKHPDDLMIGHLNELAARAIAKGNDLFDVLRAASKNPVEHYNLPVGLLQEGDPADFILTRDLKNFKIDATYINGEKVMENGTSFVKRVEATIINNFHTSEKTPDAFGLEAKSDNIRVIRAIDGELVTQSFITPAKIHQGKALADPDRDLLKMAVVNRYSDVSPALCFINGFNLKKGAIASCVGHDSHNIIAVGCDDESLCQAVNLIIQNKGGISAVFDGQSHVLPLPVAGIMTNEDGYKTGQLYGTIDALVKAEMGCNLRAPFMTLSFMALLVIPELKLSDLGLFDGKKFEFAALFV
ncbi:MAG: adenine deaminase [Saprospiraceae bacterium]|nr:adenine deaminase [Saprospiraceae bacterium]MCB9324197.1 adenine deaminase [Lewinellaceae bacterium]